MKPLIKILMALLLSSTLQINSQDPPTGNELGIFNESQSKSIWVRIYPVSIVFNGHFRCDFWGWQHLENRFDYINGRGQQYDPEKGSLYLQKIFPNDWIGYAFDDDGSAPAGSVAAIGKGEYKIEFWWDLDGLFSIRDSLILEIDGNAYSEGKI